MTELAKRRISKRRLRDPKDLPKEVWRSLQGWPRYKVSNRFRVLDTMTGQICNAIPIFARSHVILRDLSGKPHSRKVYPLVAQTFRFGEIPAHPESMSSTDILKAQSSAFQEEIASGKEPL